MSERFFYSFLKRATLDLDPGEVQIERKAHDNVSRTVFNCYDADNKTVISFNNESDLNNYIKAQHAERVQDMIFDKIETPTKARKVRKNKGKKVKKMDSVFDNYDPLAQFSIEDFLK